MSKREPRYLLEGYWSGYTYTQRKLVHREVITASRANELALRRVIFTDGTTLDLTVRPMDRGERIHPIISYSDLIYEAEHTGEKCVFVSDLTLPTHIVATSNDELASSSPSASSPSLSPHWLKSSDS